MEVRITRAAEENLGSIFSYHVEYSPDYAVDFQQKIVAFFMVNLSEHPLMGAVYNADTSVRRIIFGDYNIYYRVGDGLIDILFILHSRLSLNEELRGDQ